jgi:hypothetical protein
MFLSIVFIVLVALVFMMLPGYIQGVQFLQSLPPTFKKNAPLVKKLHSPRMFALSLPAHIVYYAIRYIIIAPLLFVLSLVGVTQRSLLVALVRFASKNKHEQAVAVLVDDVASSKKLSSRPLVFVSTYSKSGTNLTLHMANSILARGDAGVALDGDHIHATVPWPDGTSMGLPFPLVRDLILLPKRAGLVNDALVVKTHQPLSVVPLSAPNDKCIVVLRDPKDVCVSAYHFFASTALGPAMMPLSVVVDTFCNGTGLDGPWWVHADSAWRAIGKPNVKVMFYEDMVRDPTATVRAVAQFLAVDLTAAELAKVVELSSFKWMKQNNLHFDAGRSTPLSTGGEMMRAGKVGDSATELTKEQRAQIDAAMLSGLEKLGSSFPYRERYTLNKNIDD